jgi:hypothetical protein
MIMSDSNHKLYDLNWCSDFSLKNIPLRLAVIGAFLRLGKKYDFQNLFKEATMRLSFEYPSTLREWDATYGQYTFIEIVGGEPFDVIRLARENSLSFILPAALYNCCEDSSLYEIFGGLVRHDGTVTFLSAEDQRLCIQVLEDTLIHRQDYIMLEWMDPENSNRFVRCTSKSQCIAARTKHLVSMVRHDLWCDAFLKWDNKWEQGLCDHCIQTAKMVHGAGCQDLWEQLPGIFKLPPWDELRKEIP